MALNTLAAAQVTLVSDMTFGGTSSKRRKRKQFIINDPAATSGGIVVGAVEGDIPYTAFGFQSKMDNCSNLMIYTTSTGVAVRIYAAAPSLDGHSIVLSDSGQTAGAVSDVTIATTESALITIEGF